MTKHELILLIARRAGIEEEKAATIITDIFDCITDTVKNGEKVVIPNFGRFERKYRAERFGNNLSTGERVHIPGKWRPTFSASQALKKAVGKGGYDKD